MYQTFSAGVISGGKKSTTAGPSRELEGKIDYVLPFSEERKFEAGYEGESESSDERDELYEFNPPSLAFELQSQFSYSVEYRNSDHAFYSMYSDRIYGVGIQGGLRTGYTFRNISLDAQRGEFSIDRWDFFPTLHTSCKLGEFTQAMASYTRRIQRPHGWELEPTLIWIDAHNVRKGNPGMKAQTEAAADGYHQVLWLDAMEHQYIEEVGAMDVFTKIGDKILTPTLEGTILPGNTRASVLDLLREWGFLAEEKKISIEEIFHASATGDLQEMFGTGTAAVISPIKDLRCNGKKITLNNGEIGDISKKLYDTLTGIQFGTAPDIFVWVEEVR